MRKHQLNLQTLREHTKSLVTLLKGSFMTLMVKRKSRDTNKVVIEDKKDPILK